VNRERVSIIMAVRNEGHRIDRTVESLLGQTRLPDEVVLADAHSTDDTVARVRRFEDRGVPVRVVVNDSLFAGGGRNAATRAASYDLIVNMDAGNIAEPDWLEKMVGPFERDSSLEMVGGLFSPIAETPFEQISAAVCYTIDCIVPTMSRHEIEPLVPANFVPGGMCMAYRRRLWERCGGFSEWARKGQDRLFGFRARRVNGMLGVALDARLRHHMSNSISSLVTRRFFYDLWGARLCLPGMQWRLCAIYLAGALALILSYPSFWLTSAVLAAGIAFTCARAWRRLRRVSRATGVIFRPRDYPLSVVILVADDLASISGRMLGALDRLVRPRWRRQLAAYMEHGE
jgi:glycosyltransferase involved in cell wall biosynthesis